MKCLTLITLLALGLNCVKSTNVKWIQNPFHGQEPIQSPSPAELGLPTNVDWRTKGVVTPIKSQGHAYLGGYLFGTIAGIESMYAIKTGKLLSLSEQMFWDCCDQTANFLWCTVNQTEFPHGITTEASYPYQGWKGQCQESKDTGIVVKGVQNVKTSENSDKDLMTAVANLGPIIVGLNTDVENFASYNGGVFTAQDCNTGQFQFINNAMLLIGYGTENGKDYWLLKAAYGDLWGEKGFYKLERSEPCVCGICMDTQYPTF